MVDTPTKVGDVIVPEVFVPYVQEQSVKVNAFFASGIIAPVGELTFGSRGGTQVEMPFWKQLGERAQLLDDKTDLAIKKITTGQDTAVLHARALVYGATDLAGALAGDDPMRIIGDGIAANWSSEFNAMLLATLSGAMEGVTDNTNDISALSGTLSVIDGGSFIDSAQLLGDHKDQLVGLAMHSAVEASLAKNDLIETIRDSEGQIVMRTFMGKRVVVDDSMTAASGGIYTTYLFGPGAIGWGEGSPKVPSETDRAPLTNGGQEFLVSRRHFVLHPRGIRWTPTVHDSPNMQTPSDTELSNTANWSQVYDSKNIKIVKFVHKIA